MNQTFEDRRLNQGAEEGDAARVQALLKTDSIEAQGKTEMKKVAKIVAVIVGVIVALDVGPVGLWIILGAGAQWFVWPWRESVKQRMNQKEGGS